MLKLCLVSTVWWFNQNSKYSCKTKQKFKKKIITKAFRESQSMLTIVMFACDILINAIFSQFYLSNGPQRMLQLIQTPFRESFAKSGNNKNRLPITAEYKRWRRSMQTNRFKHANIFINLIRPYLYRRFNWVFPTGAMSFNTHVHLSADTIAKSHFFSFAFAFVQCRYLYLKAV